MKTKSFILLFISIFLILGCSSKTKTIQVNSDNESDVDVIQIDNPGNTAQGTLEIILSEEDGKGISAFDGSMTIKTILPEIDMTRDAFKITATCSDGSAFRLTTKLSTIQILGMPVGRWTIQAETINKDKMSIGIGRGDVEITESQTSALTLNVAPYAGFGIMAITVNWEADIQSPVLKGSLSQTNGPSYDLSFEISGKSATATVTGASGYYILRLNLYDAAGTMYSYVGGAVEIIRIMEDVATPGVYTILANSEYGYGNVNIGINVDMKDPIDIALTGQTAVLYEGQTMTVTAASPLETVNVNYTWYLNGEHVAEGNEFTTRANLPVGNYRLDVTAFNDAGDRGGSVSYLFAVRTSPPANLSYSQNPAIYTVGLPIQYNTASVTGGGIAFSIIPALPAGLTLNAGTGTISGTPTAIQSETVYTIYATNSIGSTSVNIPITIINTSRNVFYSVSPYGTGSIRTGSPTISIVNGIATLSVAQTGNVGQGCKITYDTSLVCYISLVNSPTSFNVVTATGDVPPDASAKTVNSLSHCYSSLNAANTALKQNLVTANIIMNICLYYDHSDFTPDSTANITGWTTDALRYVNLYCPNGGSESLNRQGHKGKWDITKYRIENASGTCLRIYANYTRVRGLQMYVSGIPTGNWYGIYHTSGGMRISNCFIRGTAGGSIYNGGIRSETSTAPSYVWNNIIINFNGSNGFALNQNGSQPVYYYNNTLYNCQIGFYRDAGGAAYIINNIFAGCTTLINGGITSESYNATDSSAGLSGTGDRLGQIFSFVDAGHYDFHLLSTDTGAKGYGIIDPGSGLFSDDINYETRPGDAWGIGADSRGTKIIYSCIYPAIYTLTTAENAKYGSRKFTSMYSWNMARARNLVTEREIEVSEIIGGANWDSINDTTAVNIEYGWTTDITHNITINALGDARCSIDRTKGYRIVSPSASTYAVRISAPYTVISGIGAKATGTSVTAAFYFNVNGIVLIDCLAYDTYAYTSGSRGFYSYNTGIITTLINCVAYNCNYGFVDANQGWSSWYNCVSLNARIYGFYISSGYGAMNNAKNCYSGGSGTADYYIVANGRLTLTTCRSEDGTLSTPIVAFSTSSGAYFNNITPGTEDCSIGTSSALRDAGTDLSGDFAYPFNFDYDGIIRTGLWDIGAFEAE